MRTIEGTLGRRESIQVRCHEFGYDAFSDEELVEILLAAYSTLGDDGTEIAQRALKQFGSLAEVLEASSEELQEIEGIGPSNAFGIRIVQTAARKYLRGKIIKKNYLNSLSEALDYFVHSMKGKKSECFHALYLDSQNTIIHEALISTGTPNKVYVLPGKFIERALAKGATNIVIAHNHPSGDPQPSREDIYLTSQIYMAARYSDLWLRDHLIISSYSHYSFMEEGLIIKFENEYEKLNDRLYAKTGA